MTIQDPKYQQKSKSMSSSEQNYFSALAMRYPVAIPFTPARTLFISGLKSRVLKLPYDVGNFNQGQCKKGNSWENFYQKCFAMLQRVSEDFLALNEKDFLAELDIGNEIVNCATKKDSSSQYFQLRSEVFEILAKKNSEIFLQNSKHCSDFE